MTMELSKYRKHEKVSALDNAGLYRQLFGGPHIKAACSSDLPPSDMNREISKLMGLLEQQDQEKEGQARCMSATVALLKYAHKMIERAEDTIKLQEQRIVELEELTTLDELTGLKNRRGFFEYFMRELDKCDRSLSKGGLLILIDLDNFKNINDTSGHAAGDASLRLVARTLEQEIRIMDIAARIGGDEFVLLLSNTSKECAAGRAQNLAWQLNHLSLAWYGEEIPVRASLGLRPYGPGDKAKDIFNDADLALYENKRQKKEPPK